MLFNNRWGMGRPNQCCNPCSNPCPNPCQNNQELVTEPVITNCVEKEFHHEVPQV